MGYSAPADKNDTQYAAAGGPRPLHLCVGLLLWKKNQLECHSPGTSRHQRDRPRKSRASQIMRLPRQGWLERRGLPQALPVPIGDPQTLQVNGDIRYNGILTPPHHPANSHAGGPCDPWTAAAGVCPPGRDFITLQRTTPRHPVTAGHLDRLD